MAAGACRCNGRAMMTASSAVALGVLEQLLVAAVLLVVDLHVPPGFVFGLPAVLGHQARPGGQRRLAGMVAVEGPPDVVRADVGDRLDLDELGIDRAEQHAPLVAGADHADAQRRADGLVVAEVERAQPAADHHARGHAAEDEVAAVHAGGRGLLLLSWIHAIHFVLGDLRREQRAENPTAEEEVQPAPASGPRRGDHQQGEHLDEVLVNQQRMADHGRIGRIDGRETPAASARRST